MSKQKEESEQSMQSMQNEIYGLIKGIENNLIEIYMDDELLQSLRKKKKPLRNCNQNFTEKHMT